VAESIAREAGAPFWTDDYRRLLERDDVDAVSVCVPTYLHAEVTVAALESGKHVLCEKPPARNAAEARAMQRAAADAGRILMYGFSVRFRAAHATLKRWIDAGELGRIYAARAGWMRRRGNPRGWFTEKARAGGGAMIDMGIHGLDLAWWLMGKPAPTAASGCTYREFGHYETGDSATPDPVMQLHLAEKSPGVFDVEDSAFAFVRFADGAHLVVEAAWALNCEQESRYVVLYGDRGGARLPPLALYKDLHGSTVDLRPEVPDNSPYMDEVRHFVACVRGVEEPLVTPEDGTRIMTIVDAIYASAATRREVLIGEE
jgi:predicted dehydrogenase